VLLASVLSAASACKGAKPTPATSGTTAPVTASGSAASGTTASGGIDMRLAPSKAEYRRGETITLSITLKNNQARSCHLSRVAPGAVTILSLTRDGAPVTPVLTTGSYIDGFAGLLTANLVPLAPGSSLAVPLASEPDPATGNRAALEASSLDANDQASLVFWPVDQVGHYTLTASYLLPALPGAPADLCRVSGEPVSASFAVKGG
jgi:hypothetical protein